MKRELVEEYFRKFGEGLPIFLLPSLPENKLEELVRESIKNGKRIKLTDEEQKLVREGKIIF